MDRLPEALPDGCYRKMSVHFNYGSDGGSAVYEIFAPGEIKLPITYQYDTRKPKIGKRRHQNVEPAPTGFFIDDVNDANGSPRCFRSWRDVRAFWPEYAALRAQPSPGEEG